jgi:hypothetical protein
VIRLATLKARQVLSAITPTPPVIGTIAMTPLDFSAALASKPLMPPPILGLVRTVAQTMPGILISMPNVAVPVDFATMSMRCILEAQAVSRPVHEPGSLVLDPCIAGPHQCRRFSPSSGPRRSCGGTRPAFAATGVGSRALREGDQ